MQKENQIRTEERDNCLTKLSQAEFKIEMMEI